ncbi:MAG: transporter substrate-binding domain-containing protein [Verrucomicrobiaceae bacterium]|nr:transporter substrate-binding domain-containing protein [Verrucomicrobiaceae bacterium]
MKAIISLILLHLTMGAALPAAPPMKIRVAMDSFPPMSSKEGGFDLDLIESLAELYNWDTQILWTENVEACLQAVRNGEAELAISGISITEEREKLNDFTHPYFDSGIYAMLLRNNSLFDRKGLLAAWPTLRNALIALLIILLFFAHLIWLMERTGEEVGGFASTYLRGVGQGIWWTLVTSSTVGYGDIVPKKLRGRILAGGIIIVGITWFGLFISAMTSTFATLTDESRIVELSDFAGKSVATKNGSTSETHLKALTGVKVLTFSGIDQAYQALLDGKVEAVVFDAPALMAIARNDKRVIVANRFFDEQKYGIALPTQSPHREKLNQGLLALKKNGRYNEIYAKWFE